MYKVAGLIENTIFANHFVSGPYERLFLEPGQESQFIRNYIDFYAGSVEYIFRIEEYFNLLVVGLQSPLGLVSLVVMPKEDLVKLPDYIQNTKMMYVVDSIDAVYAKAERNGIAILQKRTPNIMGAQGRLQIAPGYIVELAEATNKSLFDPDLDSLGLPPEKVLV